MLSNLPLRRHLLTGLATALLCLAPPLSATQALKPEQLPKELQDWVPWAMQGHENLACPGNHDDPRKKHCVWPNRLELAIDGRQGRFSLDVEVIGTDSAVMLPGEAGAWPEQVRREQGEALPITSQQGRPVVWLPPGRHQLQGKIRWNAAPRTIRLPAHTGLLTVRLDGKEIHAVADQNGQLWLQQASKPDDTARSASNTLDINIRRLIDDDIPRRITTRYTLNVGGQPREIDLPAALLPQTQPEALRSTLPARLYPTGRLQVQLRAGTWHIDVDARQMQAVGELGLPADAPGDEVWSYRGHNALHITRIDGVTGVDPSQAQVPDAWQSLPAYQMQADSRMQIIESTRGNAYPGANQLELTRELWLDFDGGGFTQKDLLHGSLSRDWRLQQSGPAVLGHANANGSALPITRLDSGGDGTPPPGVELRHSNLSLMTLSRIEGRPEQLPINGWNTILDSATTTLHLPPGWTLLSTTGIDEVNPPTWTSRWRLFDLFFVLLGSIAAFKLLGAARGALLTAAILLSWYEFAAVGTGWLILLVCVGLARLLPAQTKAHRLVLWSGHGLIALMLLALLPFTVQEVRRIIYPALEHSSAYDPSRQRSLDMEAPVPATLSTKQRSVLSEADFSSQEKLQRAARDMGLSPNRQAQEALKSQQPVPIQTGPGVPAWTWNQYTLHTQGDIQPDQPMRLYLLPPFASALQRLLSLLVIYATLWTLFRSLPAVWRRSGGSTRHEPPPAEPPKEPPGNDSSRASSALLAMALLSAALGLGAIDEARAGTKGETSADTGSASALHSEKAGLMQELRERLHPAPDCTPNCAALAELRVTADRQQLRLRLNLHVQTRTQVPLPGLDSSDNWRMSQILHNGRPATLRRDEQGRPWILLSEGVHSVELSGPLGSGASVRIPLPLRPMSLLIDSGIWQAQGLNASGLPHENLLTLEQQIQSTDAAAPQLAHLPDALPGFALVERTLIADDRWQVQTRITRQSVSQAPVHVRFALLPGESVNDDRVQVRDGVAEVMLGHAQRMELNSTLPIGQTLHWRALPALNQIERWRLRYSSRWHPEWKGLTPIHFTDSDGLLAPLWQPWPGEALQLNFRAPEVVAGPTLTQEQHRLEISPGEHSTTVQTLLSLRATLAGTQAMQLPADAEFLGMTLDGTHVPLQAKQGRLDVPVVPGEHDIVLRWREPRGTQGIGTRFGSTPLDTGLPGVNAVSSIELPPNRVVLAAGGPLIGPALLFWGFVPLILLGAIVLGRSKLTPLGIVGSFLLLLGLAQASLTGALLVAGWFLALGLRPSLPQMRARGWDTGRIQMIQAVLGFWTMFMLITIYQTVHTALLGYPNLLITGNGSSAHQLFWYQDRFLQSPDSVWVFSISLTAYRVAMLAWALWLAASLIGWFRWGWQRFSNGGYWSEDPPPSKPRPDGPRPPASTDSTESGAAVAATAPPADLDRKAVEGSAGMDVSAGEGRSTGVGNAPATSSAAVSQPADSPLEAPHPDGGPAGPGSPAAATPPGQQPPTRTFPLKLPSNLGRKILIVAAVIIGAWLLLTLLTVVGAVAFHLL